MTAVEVLQEWPEPEPKPCLFCNGTGQLHLEVDAVSLLLQTFTRGMHVRCPHCNGTGIEPERSET